VAVDLTHVHAAVADGKLEDGDVRGAQRKEDPIDEIGLDGGFVRVITHHQVVDGPSGRVFGVERGGEVAEDVLDDGDELGFGENSRV